jgi:hypothetical protein
MSFERTLCGLLFLLMMTGGVHVAHHFSAVFFVLFVFVVCPVLSVSLACPFILLTRQNFL